MTIYSLDNFSPELPEPGIFWIAPEAVVVGRVRIKQHVSIWFGAVVRGDDEQIEIGEHSNIQDGCVLHADPGYPLIIGRNCTLGHKAVVHGCTIGDNSLIGMSATIMNGVRIGRNCLIGANSFIPENKVIPNNSLVMGAPGKVVRELDEAGIRGLSMVADQYDEKWRRYAQGMKLLP
jgi:carbonic anhydrase/acetyltransferase-like protein (isoleucine patch superfamily)